MDRPIPSFSSLPPHIQPPIAHVPRATREAALLKSSEFDMLHFALPFEIFGWLASGFQVLSGAVARMSGRGEAINNSVLRG